MSKIQETIDKVRKCKEHYVNLQKFHMIITQELALLFIQLNLEIN